MKKVLIFGMGGFVGPYLAQEFLNYGYKVYGSDKEHTARIQNEICFEVADLLDGENVLRLVTEIKPDMIINLAGVSSVGDSWNIPQATMMVNVVGTLNIMEAAKKQTYSPKLMFIGSSEEYVESDSPMAEDTELNGSNPYGISKETQEKFVKLYREQYNMKIYYARPFNHTGIGQRETFVLPSFCRQVAEIEKSGKPGVMKVGNLSVKRDFSHVKDIVRAYRMIIESDNCEIIYNVGSGVTYELREMLNYIVGLCHQKIEVQIEAKRFRLTDQSIICCDRTLIGKKLGWEPEYTVFDALKEMYEKFVGDK